LVGNLNQGIRLDAGNPVDFFQNFTFTGKIPRILQNLIFLMDQGARKVMDTKLRDDSDQSILQALLKALQDPDLTTIPKGVIYSSPGTYSFDSSSSASSSSAARTTYIRDMRDSMDKDLLPTNDFPDYDEHDFDTNSDEEEEAEE
jgi:hypothetical protein